MASFFATGEIIKFTFNVCTLAVKRTGEYVVRRSAEMNGFTSDTLRGSTECQLYSSDVNQTDCLCCDEALLIS